MQLSCQTLFSPLPRSGSLATSTRCKNGPQRQILITLAVIPDPRAAPNLRFSFSPSEDDRRISSVNVNPVSPAPTVRQSSFFYTIAITNYYYLKPLNGIVKKIRCSFIIKNILPGCAASPMSLRFPPTKPGDPRQKITIIKKYTILEGSRNPGSVKATQHFDFDLFRCWCLMSLYNY